MLTPELNSVIENLQKQGVVVKVEDAQKDLQEVIAGQCNGGCSQGQCSGGSGYRPTINA